MNQYIAHVISTISPLELLFLGQTESFPPLRVTASYCPPPSMTGPPPQGLIPEEVLDAFGGDEWPEEPQSITSKRPALPDLLGALGRGD